LNSMQCFSVVVNFSVVKIFTPRSNVCLYEEYLRLILREV